MTRHVCSALLELFFAVPRDSALVDVWFTAWGGGCNMLVHRGGANHRVSVLEPHRIPLEHTGRTLLILGCVISMEESVLETLLFGLPSLTLQLHMRLYSLPSAPVNARGDGFHGSSPLLDHNQRCGACLPHRPVISGTPSVGAKRMPGNRHSVSCAGCPICSSQLQGSNGSSGDDDGIFEKARVENLQDEASSPCSIRNGLKNHLTRKDRTMTDLTPAAAIRTAVFSPASSRS
jgi:hypothetical protein